MAETIETLGKYEVKRTLGKGAMGTVYEGWDPIIARRVAIKTVRIPDTHDDPETEEALARFRREAQAAGRLTHPNIVGVFDYGETGDIAYIVMEYVDGPSVKSLVDRQERFGLPETLRIMTDLLNGLQFSHARGVVHRDIKPANIMLTSEGQGKIADFGIARIESSSMTQAGTVLGTPAYMSPEQFMGQVVDARTDIYSSGVVLYQLLTGERPFEGGMSAIMHKALNTDPPLPSQMSVTCPTAFDGVVRKAMAKRPEERFQSAAAFLEAVQAAAAGKPLPGMPVAEVDEAEATMVAPSARRAAAPAAPAFGGAPAARAASAGPAGRAAAAASVPAAARGCGEAILDADDRRGGGRPAGAGGRWRLVLPVARPGACSGLRGRTECRPGLPHRAECRTNRSGGGAIDRREERAHAHGAAGVHCSRARVHCWVHCWVRCWVHCARARVHRARAGVHDSRGKWAATGRRRTGRAHGAGSAHGTGAASGTAGVHDAGPHDAGSHGAGPHDAGSHGAGPHDAGSNHAGRLERIRASHRAGAIGLCGVGYAPPADLRAHPEAALRADRRRRPPERRRDADRTGGESPSRDVSSGARRDQHSRGSAVARERRGSDVLRRDRRVAADRPDLREDGVAPGAVPGERPDRAA